MYVVFIYSFYGFLDGCLNYYFFVCDDNVWGLCVGNIGSNYVYEIKEGIIELVLVGINFF